MVGPTMSWESTWGLVMERYQIVLGAAAGTSRMSEGFCKVAVGEVGVVKGRTSASPSKKTSLDIAECGKQSRPVVVVNCVAIGVKDMWLSAVAAGFM